MKKAVSPVLATVVLMVIILIAALAIALFAFGLVRYLTNTSGSETTLTLTNTITTCPTNDIATATTNGAIVCCSRSEFPNGCFQNLVTTNTISACLIQLPMVLMSNMTWNGYSDMIVSNGTLPNGGTWVSFGHCNYYGYTVTRTGLYPDGTRWWTIRGTVTGGIGG